MFSDKNSNQPKPVTQGKAAKNLAIAGTLGMGCVIVIGGAIILSKSINNNQITNLGQKAPESIAISTIVNQQQNQTVGIDDEIYQKLLDPQAGYKIGAVVNEPNGGTCDDPTDSNCKLADEIDEGVFLIDKNDHNELNLSKTILKDYFPVNSVKGDNNKSYLQLAFDQLGFYRTEKVIYFLGLADPLKKIEDNKSYLYKWDLVQRKVTVVVGGENKIISLVKTGVMPDGSGDSSDDILHSDDGKSIFVGIDYLAKDKNKGGIAEIDVQTGAVKKTYNFVTVLDKGIQIYNPINAGELSKDDRYVWAMGQIEPTKQVDQYNYNAVKCYAKIDRQTGKVTMVSKNDVAAAEKPEMMKTVFP